MYPNASSTGGVAPLPPYRALLIVDVKEFSGRKGRYHGELTAAIPRILQQAFRRCGLSDLWEEAQFHGTTGDGYFLGFRPAVLPFLINPFLQALQEELDYRGTISTVSGPEQDLRMRVSVNVGPMADSGMNGLGDGSGDARIENHRLLDSEPVRDLLTRSSPITRVAGIVSLRAFEDAVLSGFTGDDPDLYVPVHVEVKSYRGDAYLRVPKPSGDLLVRGFQPSEPETGVTESTVDTKSRGLRLPVGSGSVSNFVGTVLGGSVVQAEEVGDITIGGGNIGHVDGSVVQGPSGPVHTGSGNQVNLPGLADGPGDGDRAAENA